MGISHVKMMSMETQTPTSEPSEMDMSSDVVSDNTVSRECREISRRLTQGLQKAADLSQQLLEGMPLETSTPSSEKSGEESVAVADEDEAEFIAEEADTESNADEEEAELD